MALIFHQTAPSLSLAQSPIAFSVVDTSDIYSGSEFMYTANLTYWTGSMAASGSTDYIVKKFPNKVGVGMFDFSRVLNSALDGLAIENKSNVLYYKSNFNYSYWSGSEYVSSSTSLTSSVHQVIDGYALFPEEINQETSVKTSYWNIMTDGPVSQSISEGDTGTFGVYVNSTGVTASFTGSYVTGTTATGSYVMSGSALTAGKIAQLPFAVGQAGFPLSTTGLTSYTVKAGGSALYFDVVCTYKYTPVRICWKNRYGQFDFLNFYKAKSEGFKTDSKDYKPQLGSWANGTALTYNPYQNTTQKYMVNSTETLEVNSDWLPESYNTIFKQFMVSDEMYWMYDMPNGLVKPISLTTNNIKFKTGINDKLISYSFSFDIGTTFKLTL